MVWLLAFLVKNAVAISAIGVTAGAIASVEQVVINTVKVVEVVREDDKKD